MKNKIFVAIFLLILGGVFMSIPQKAVSRQERYNTCHRHVDDGWMEGGVICETDTKVCYLFDPEGKVAVLLYCENK